MKVTDLRKTVVWMDEPVDLGEIQVKLAIRPRAITCTFYERFNSEQEFGLTVIGDALIEAVAEWDVQGEDGKVLPVTRGNIMDLFLPEDVRKMLNAVVNYSGPKAESASP